MEHATRHDSLAGGDVSRTDLRAAVSALYEEQHVRMLRFAAARLGDIEAGRDAVNDAFVLALRRLSSLRDPVALESWVWSILVNETRRHRRWRKSQRHESLESASEVAACPEPQVDHDLRNLIRGLPNRQRTVLFLTHYGDLTGARIAEILGIAPATVRSTLHQAHAALQQRLIEGRPTRG